MKIKKSTIKKMIAEEIAALGEGYAEDEEQRSAAYEAEMARRKRNVHKAKEDKELKKKYVEKNFPNADQDFVDDQLAEAHDEGDPSATRPGEEDYTGHKGDDSKTHSGKDYDSLPSHLKGAVEKFKKDVDRAAMDTPADNDNPRDPLVSLMNDFLANLNIEKAEKTLIYQELAEYYHEVLVPRAQREMPRAPIEDPFKDIAEGFKRFRK